MTNATRYYVVRDDSVTIDPQCAMPQPETVTYKFSYDRNDRDAPLGISVEDAFRNTPEPRPWRVTVVRVVRFPNGEAPVVGIEGVPLTKSGDADRRATYTRMMVAPEIEAAFVEAAR